MKIISPATDDFKSLIDRNSYYVDKSLMIKDIIEEDCVSFTRPRRFGKTLNMSMLYYFFSIDEKDNAYLFHGLEIEKYAEVMKYQNQYPVIFISLKDMRRLTYESQIEKFSSMIADLVLKYPELITSNKLDESEKKMIDNYRFGKTNENNLMDALYNISKYLYKHFGKKVIILIDEYDVPLQKAYVENYYDKMVNFISNVFSIGLKSNEYLEKGILTGCLRIGKESIFTGLNNPSIYSITHEMYSSYFGFTEKEVKDMLDYYGLGMDMTIIRDWYDGYLFGNTEIYNPVSVLKYVNKAIKGYSTPENFWANTSGNDIVYDYISSASYDLYQEFEQLMEGRSIQKRIEPELTYREMDDINNIYSFLLFTGYLKVKNTVDPIDNVYELEIPNREVRAVYENSFTKWFRAYREARGRDFVGYLLKGQEKKAQLILNQIMDRSISYYDEVESFYHGFLAGVLNHEGYDVRSNRESGDGRYDLLLIPTKLENPCIVIECKLSSSLDNLEKDSLEGIKQIRSKRYDEGLLADGYDDVYSYGISFYKKRCFISKG